MIAKSIRRIPALRLTRTFSKFIPEQSFSVERPAQDRVVSTPQWPVPYYERKFRSYAVRETHIDYSDHGKPISEFHAYHNKERLQNNQKGREFITYVEDNVQLESKLKNPKSRLCYD